MNGTDLLKALGQIDDTLVEKNTQPPKKKIPKRHILPLAACIAVLLCAGILLQSLLPGLPSIPKKLLANANLSPEKANGLFFSGELGSPEDSLSNTPPLPRFAYESFVVVGKVTDVLPDTYYQLKPHVTATPTAFRLLRLEIREVVSGIGVPEDILYMIPEYLVANIDSYDTLVMAISQYGCDEAVLWNGSAGEAERFDLLFCDYWNEPHLGNIIAFTDGIFDESLWQNKSWGFGYQFMRHMLDDPDEYNLLMVRRGSHLSEVLQEIRKRLQSEKKAPPAVQRYSFKSDEVNALLEELRFFENGLFVPVMANEWTLQFQRFIFGCPTNEVITIDVETEQLTYSEYYFTEEDLESIVNLPQYIKENQPATEDEIPQPPHFSSTGMEKWAFGRCGWYEKNADGVSGIVKTVWLYRDPEAEYSWHFDESFLYFDMARNTMEPRTPEYYNNYYKYGEPFGMPYC